VTNELGVVVGRGFLVLLDNRVAEGSRERSLMILSLGHFFYLLDIIKKGRRKRETG